VNGHWESTLLLSLFPKEDFCQRSTTGFTNLPIYHFPRIFPRISPSFNRVSTKMTKPGDVSTYREFSSKNSDCSVLAGKRGETPSATPSKGHSGSGEGHSDSLDSLDSEPDIKKQRVEVDNLSLVGTMPVTGDGGSDKQLAQLTHNSFVNKDKYGLVDSDVDDLSDDFSVIEDSGVKDDWITTLATEKKISKGDKTELVLYDKTKTGARFRGFTLNLFADTNNGKNVPEAPDTFNDIFFGEDLFTKWDVIFWTFVVEYTSNQVPHIHVLFITRKMLRYGPVVKACAAAGYMADVKASVDGKLRRRFGAFEVPRSVTLEYIKFLGNQCNYRSKLPDMNDYDNYRTWDQGDKITRASGGTVPLGKSLVTEDLSLYGFLVGLRRPLPALDDAGQRMKNGRTCLAKKAGDCHKDLDIAFRAVAKEFMPFEVFIEEWKDYPETDRLHIMSMVAQYGKQLEKFYRIIQADRFPTPWRPLVHAIAITGAAGAGKDWFATRDLVTELWTAAMPHRAVPDDPSVLLYTLKMDTGRFWELLQHHFMLHLSDFTGADSQLNEVKKMLQPGQTKCYKREWKNGSTEVFLNAMYATLTSNKSPMEWWKKTLHDDVRGEEWVALRRRFGRWIWAPSFKIKGFEDGLTILGCDEAKNLDTTQMMRCSDGLALKNKYISKEECPDGIGRGTQFLDLTSYFLTAETWKLANDWRIRLENQKRDWDATYIADQRGESVFDGGNQNRAYGGGQTYQYGLQGNPPPGHRSFGNGL